MTFLPEDDQDYLRVKGLKFELKTEPLPDGSDRRGVLFPAFEFKGNLFSGINGQLARCGACDLLILIPPGYSTTKLDSFYTTPRLKRADGTDPDRASGESDLFGSKWQFWSRHLEDTEWRLGIDGLATFLHYVRTELRRA
jgi:hypothetical protein